MGILLDPPEYPNHVAVPSGFDVHADILALMVVMGILPLCPEAGEMLPPDDPPQPDYTPRSFVVRTPAPSSISGNVTINIPTGQIGFSSQAPSLHVGMHIPAGTIASSGHAPSSRIS